MGRYRPSVHDIHEYSPMKQLPAQKYISGSPQSDLPLPSERYNNYKRQQLVEEPKAPTSARNVVSSEMLNQIKQLAIN